jgi:hypothetical protein
MKRPQQMARIKVLNDINNFVVEVTHALNGIEGKCLVVFSIPELRTNDRCFRMQIV